MAWSPSIKERLFDKPEWPSHQSEIQRWNKWNNHHEFYFRWMISGLSADRENEPNVDIFIQYRKGHLHVWFMPIIVVDSEGLFYLTNQLLASGSGLEMVRVSICLKMCW